RCSGGVRSGRTRRSRREAPHVRGVFTAHRSVWTASTVAAEGVRATAAGITPRGNATAGRRGTAPGVERSVAFVRARRADVQLALPVLASPRRTVESARPAVVRIGRDVDAVAAVGEPDRTGALSVLTFLERAGTFVAAAAAIFLAGVRVDTVAAIGVARWADAVAVLAILEVSRARGVAAAAVVVVPLRVD